MRHGTPQQLLALIITATLAALPAAGQNYNWSGNGADNNWSTAANWSFLGSPPSGVATVVVFKGTNRLSPVQNIANPFILNQLTFDFTAGSFTLGGNGLNFGGSVPRLNQNSSNPQTVAVPLTLASQAGSVIVAGAGTGAVMLTGAVTGTSGLTMVGGYTLTLAGAGSSFSGGLYVSAGTVQLGGNNILTAASPAVSVGGGTFDLNGFNQTLGSLALSSSSTTGRPTVTTGAGTLTLGGNISMDGGGGTNGSGGGPGCQISGTLNLGGAKRSIAINGLSGEAYDCVVSAAISGSGGLNYNGIYGGNYRSNFALNGANSYTGATTINTGDLQATAANALPATTSVSLTNANSVLSLYASVTANGVTAGSYNQSIASLTGVAGSIVALGSATLTVGGDNSSTTFAGGINGSGAVVKTGTGTLTLTGSNGYTGGTFVTGGGTLRLGAPGGGLAGTGAVSVAGSTFDGNGFSQQVGALALSSAAGSGRPMITTGNGILTLGGDITMDGGGLRFNGGPPAGPGGRITGKIDLGGATRTFNVTRFSAEYFDLVVSAAVSGNGGLTCAGVFDGLNNTDFALANANTYTGATTVSGGNLFAAAANALPATTAVNLTLGTAALVLNPAFSLNGVTAGNYSQSIGSLAGVAGSAVSLGSATLTVGSDNTNTAFYGNVVGSGTLIKTGFGNLTLGGTGNTANITVQQGYLVVNDLASNSGAGNLGTGAFTLNGGELYYNGPTATSTKPISLASFGYIQVFGNGTNLTLNGDISQVAGAAGLEIMGPYPAANSSTLTLGGTNNYVEATIVGGNAIVAVATIPNGGIAGPIGASFSDPGNLQLGSALPNTRGTLLLTGTNSTYSTDRGVTVGGNSTAFDGTGGVISVQNAGTTLTMSGQIVGTSFNPGNVGNLIKAGAGTLILTNTANIYATASGGGTSIEAGTLTVGVPGAVIPAGSNVAVAAGATFSIGFTTGSNSTAPIGMLTLNGGTFQMPAGSPLYFLTQFSTGAAGGTVDLSGSNGSVVFTGPGSSSVTINGTTIWKGGQANGEIDQSSSVGLATMAIAPGVSLTDSLLIVAFGGGFRVTGGGTFNLQQTSNSFPLPLTVSQGKVRVDDLTVTGSASVLGSTGHFTLDGGTLQYTGGNQTTPFPITLGPGGGTIEVNNPSNPNTTLTLTGPITANGTYLPGPLVKAGPGTLILNSNPGNSYYGGIVVDGGVLSVGSDAQLGQATVTVNPAGTLLYNTATTTTTTRTFNLNYGTLSADSGTTLALNGAAVNGGFLRGSGTFAVTGGTTLSGVTTATSAAVNVTGAGSFVNFTNGGSLTITAPAAAPTTLNLFTNQGSGAMLVGAGSQVNAADFQTYGLLTLTPATGSDKTLLTNVGTTPLFFNGGSRTFVGSVGGTAARSGIELNGQNAIVAGGLLVNNGQVTDSSAAGVSTVIADYGALVKGAGTYDNSPITRNGGKFQAGNSPGVATMGRFVFGPGGVSNYVFAIDDATGQAGPTPDTLGQVSGWGLVKTAQWQRTAGMTSGDFVWTADPTNKLTFAIDTLVNPTTVGTDVPGLMADFDPMRFYSWPAVEWTGMYSGPTELAALNAATNFDTSGFANPITGAFGWSLDSAGQTLSLTYTPSAVPEPGTLVMASAAAFGWTMFGRRRRTGRP
jgi:autotransporter-associated beta strand protein